jgi:hypothetical protein
MVGEIIAVWFGSVHQLAMVRPHSARKNLFFRIKGGNFKANRVAVT